MSGVADVASETGRDPDGLCPGAGAPRRTGGLERSVRPAAPMPATLLVAQMCDDAFLLQGWRDGPSAYLIAEDAGPLRQALAAAFGRAVSGSGHAGTAEEVRS